ncbi:MAG TPA: BON domain-containing protein [Usitatibacter sp.]|nr:BON domain-containing protein [Usitatibacter sp.]
MKLAIALFTLAAAALAVSAGADEAPKMDRSVGTLDGATEFSYSADAAPADATDRAVAERVMDALAQEPALEGSAITVVVEQRRVRLSGATRDEDQAAYAVEVARDAAGAAVEVTGDDLHPGERDDAAS